MHFYRKCWFDPFEEQFISPFFCPIARHLCLGLPFILYSILKQCWSVGYVSLLTLSFIYNMYQTSGKDFLKTFSLLFLSIQKTQELPVEVINLAVSAGKCYITISFCQISIINVPYTYVYILYLRRQAGRRLSPPKTKCRSKKRSKSFRK